MKPLCRHCRVAAITRPRQLCWKCSNTPEILALYPSKTAHYQQEPPEQRRDRQPGEPHFKCLWCAQWRCGAPLSKCAGCVAEYLQMAVQMPVEREEYPQRKPSEKTCNRCGETKPLKDFYAVKIERKNGTVRHKYEYCCRKCAKTYQKVYREKRKQKSEASNV